MFKAAVVTLIVGLSITWTTQAKAEVTLERQQQLMHLLRHDCGSCHGMSLNGGLGPPLTPQALTGKSPEYLVDMIYHGLPEQAMPPWKGLLTQTEIRWLVYTMLKGATP